MSHIVTPQTPAQQAGRDGFRQALHAEWTKFRTTPGWVTGTAVAALLIVLFAVLTGISSVQDDAPPVPIGPDGGPVTDSFYFAHRTLTGDGSVTVSVSALRSGIPTSPDALRPGSVPWAKAGLIIKGGDRQGSPYAAIMVTGGHGVRMQDGFVHDTPGPSGGPVRWLRLDRSGDAISGYASSDGRRWTKVGAARVSGLGPAVRGGLFVASPPSVDGMGTSGTVSTAVFGEPRTRGDWSGGDWAGEQIGPTSPTFAGYPRNVAGSVTRADGRLTVTGAGDIAPAVRETLPTGGTLGEILTGTFAALIAVAVVGALFVTAEYRRNLIHVTLAATPRRGRVLAAKAIVLGAVTFVAGLVGAAVAIPLGGRLARSNGVYIFPVASATQVRVAVGIAALLAVASVLALAVGAVVRHSAAAVTVVVVAVVVPYLLTAVPFMPASAANWAARTTPAAAFAVQQTLEPYHQVASIYTPYEGYYPLAPWAGLAVLTGYALAALAVAAVLLRRRDA
jgi:hypothetical protein